MKEKGFTLIELLAVIVILAIIALIATPIILNIIKDSKESSNQRSIELYGKAVENAIGRYQIKYTEEKEITLAKLEEENLIEYKGNKVECEIKINKDGTVYLDKCKVDNKEVEYTYGTLKEENKSTIVYRNSKDKISIGDTINPNDTTKFTADPTTLGKNYYLKHVVDKDNEVIESYACGIFNGKETCLRGGSSDYYGYAANEGEYTGNLLILKGLRDEGFNCYFSDNNAYCNSGDYISGVDYIYLYANLDGRVYAYDGAVACDIFGSSSSFGSGSSVCQI